MAVQNQLTTQPPQTQETGMVEYECGGQTVKLSPSMIRRFLVSGNGQVTDQEVMMFLSLCKYQGINPFLREAYLIKYGTQPATIVTGKETFLKRAMRNPAYQGHEAGVVVLLKDGLIDNRKGTVVLEGEKLLGGWAMVHIKGWQVPLLLTVDFNEYCLRKADGTPMSNWASKPATMIRKVALVQALREAFPEDLGGMYAPEERAVDELPEDIITQETVEEQEEPVEQQPEPVIEEQQEKPKAARKPAISTEISQKGEDARAALFGK